MNWTKFFMLACLSAGAARMAVAADDPAPQRRPNFVIFFTDDQGYGDVGCFGGQGVRTPRLDQMAKEGMRLTSFYAQTVCGPSRGALLTGRYPVRVGGGWQTYPQEVTLAEVLKQAGYATCCIGKWDMSGRKYVEDRVPNAQGFDEFFGTLGANDNGKVTLWRNREQLRTTEDMGELTGLYTDEAINYLRREKDGPFLLYIAHTMAHVKLGASAEFRGKSQRGLYGDVIEELDWSMGRVLDTLREMNLDDRTVVLFCTDNGPWLTKGAAGGSAGPLRNGKTSHWEGGFRVPAIIRAPGIVPAGAVRDDIVSTLDVLPTFAALAGAKTPDDRPIDGVDQTPLLTGKSEHGARNEFFYHVGSQLRAVRRNQWKLILPGAGKRGRAPIVEPELYDLVADIGESKDVAAEHQDVVDELLKLAETARRDVVDSQKQKPGAR
ncbi:MAG: sulfatase [Planctomycetales bacterium]|nr:sulfatase [Planctomycetales bacterium]